MSRHTAPGILFLVSCGLFSAADAGPDTAYFHTYDRMMRKIETLAGRFPALCRVETLALTETGRRAVVAVKVSDNPGIDEPEPSVMFDGVHHGCEVIGTEICLSLLQSLLYGYVFPNVRRLVDSLQIYIVPMVNPDGHSVNFAGPDTLWRKNTRDNNGNGRFDSADGVDLNRNYPFLWEQGGSGQPSSREYRGPAALSEPETQGMARLTRRQRFLANICYHSSQQAGDWEKVYYPWYWSGTLSQDFPFAFPIAESVAASIGRDDGTGTYAAAVGFATSGGMYRNWSYYSTGTISLTVEVGRGYYPDTSMVDSLVRRNLRGAGYLLNRMLGPGIWGRVYDSATGEPLSATVSLLETDPVNARPVLPRRSDSILGRFYRLVVPGAYSLRISCPGYVPKKVGLVVLSGPSSLEIGLSRQESGWQEAAQMPVGLSGETAREGAWLAVDSAGLVYVAKGGKTTEFYRYDPAGDAWLDMEPLPGVEQGSKRLPFRGAKGVCDGGRYLYATRGNNTSEFWRYDAAGRKWDSLASVPDGPSGRKVKAGTGLAFVRMADTGWVYLLKGGTNEFWRYNVRANRWEELPSAPGVRRPESGAAPEPPVRISGSRRDSRRSAPGLARTKYAEGSFLVYDGGNYIYAHQARYNDGEKHYMFRYNVITKAWDTSSLSGLPLAGMFSGAVRNKKSRAGACGTWQNGMLYALKGGGTGQLYRYLPGRDSWEELDTLPGNGSTGKMKYVRGGADIVSLGDGTLLALKGNKTLELWRYAEGPLHTLCRTPHAGNGTDGEMTRLSDSWDRVSGTLSITPNPIVAGAATLRLATGTATGVERRNPGQSPARLGMYDAAGRCVLVRRLVAPDWKRGIPLDLRSVPAGVYLFRLDASGFTATEKAVVTKED